MQSAPEKITSSLVDQLNKIREKKIAKAPFLFTRMKQDVDKLREISVSDADMILGMIASLEGDEEEMRKRHKNAIRYAPHNEQYTSNYVTSLVHFLRYREAAEQEYALFEVSGKSSIKHILSAIEFYLFAGLVHESHRLIEESEGLLGQVSDRTSFAIVQYLVNLEKEDETIINTLKVKLDTVFEIMRQGELPNVGRSVTLEKVGDETWWRLNFKVLLEVGELVDLENAINEKLSKKHCEHLEDGFVEVFFESDDEEYNKLLQLVDENNPNEGMVKLDEGLLKRISEALG